MMLLLNHLEQISSSARTIGDLAFLQPKIFTNALLGHHEITTLIRDTEAHERALFSVDPHAKIVPAARQSHRRTTLFPLDENRAALSRNLVSRKQSAVARVLGSHILHEIEGHGGSARSLQSSGVNVEVLLKGAEKLCAVYSIEEASERITSLRNRYKQVAESVAFYEAKVASQTGQVNYMNKNLDRDGDYSAEDDETIAASVPITDDELRAEEQSMRELERKKRSLEERVASMENDLGGLSH